MAAASSPSLTCGKLSAWILFAVFLQILGLSLFVIGFFPVKPALHGKSGLESYTMPSCDPDVGPDESNLGPEQLRSLFKEMSGIPPAFDRLIMMVVDGLPAEFVLGRGEKPPSKSMMEAMPYTRSLLSSGRAMGYHAKAAPPTVTMPRLKAMVSGAIGGFLDVAFNFNTQAFLDDNLLDQFSRIGWNMVMLGDETWIKLFPRLFTRHDGVSSFFVKDTIEVDFNVSRHLEFELAATDWDLLILHYLGLDHVGHTGGRRSALMAPKLREMDDVIKMIHMHKILQHNNLDKRTLLVVVSDHGMTDGGNHGGSSYEETDSLALFIGGDSVTSDYASNANNAVFQVDLAPTLALLLGVPIPKNNIGIMIPEVLSSFAEKQRLRALELNCWQLLRLLQAHSPGLLCGNLSHGISDKRDSQVSGSVGNTQERLHHLFLKASAAHRLWEHQWISNTDDFDAVVASYYDFLQNASKWLSHRATDKPLDLLLSGVAIMFASCILLLIVLLHFFKALCWRQGQISQMKECRHNWHLDEAFVIVGTSIHILSLGSSSLVEEEQYTWHFLVSTMYLIFLLMAVKSLFDRKVSVSIEVIEDRALHEWWNIDVSSSRTSATPHLAWLKNIKDYHKVLLILTVLVCGRLLRGWHQGGVNWGDLPDVSKWLERAGVSTIKSLQIISLLMVMILSSFSIGVMRSRTFLANLVIVSHLASGLLVCSHIMGNWGKTTVPEGQSSTWVAQIFYIIISVTLVITIILSPWILPVDDYRTHSITRLKGTSHSINRKTNSLLVGITDSMYLIGMTFTASWCLLQLLLQQPINSAPTLLIFLQLFASVIYFSADVSCRQQWIEVVAIYFLGMAGHFGLGNSNSLATIDVAGAFIGISSHSTIFSGILMFMITYASPILAFISMLIYISLKDVGHQPCTKDSEFGCILQKTIAFPCFLPLALNSIALTAFTIILLLMRDHLFIWSVFSPKYLYICAMTLSVYVGVSIIAVTGLYVCTVFFFRRKELESSV